MHSLGGLGGDGDIGAVAGGPKRDGQADAAAGAGHEQGLAFQRHHAGSFWLGLTPYPRDGTKGQPTGREGGEAAILNHELHEIHGKG